LSDPEFDVAREFVKTASARYKGQFME